MIVQLLFHTTSDDVEVIDLIILEPGREFRDQLTGAPITLALRVPPPSEDAMADALAVVDRWIDDLVVVELEHEWVLGDERLTVTDGEGSAVVMQLVA